MDSSFKQSVMKLFQKRIQIQKISVFKVFSQLEHFLMHGESFIEVNF